MRKKKKGEKKERELGSIFVSSQLEISTDKLRLLRREIKEKEGKEKKGKTSKPSSFWLLSFAFPLAALEGKRPEGENKKGG